MRQNRTLAQLRKGKPAIGLWLQTHHYHTARIIAAQGLFDWLVVDMEHTPVDLSTASMIFSAIADISGGQCTPMARVAQGTMYQIKQALDAGAQGIIAPMVSTADAAASVVRFARYPPLGERGAGGLLPHYSFGTTSHVEYVNHANDEIMVSIQIETREAVENIEAILDTPGIDLVFIGPFDLHISLGLPPGLWSDEPLFHFAIQKVIDACKRRNLSESRINRNPTPRPPSPYMERGRKTVILSPSPSNGEGLGVRFARICDSLNLPYGTLSPNADGAKQRLADDFTLIGLGSDLGQLLGALQAQSQQVRSALGDS